LHQEIDQLPERFRAPLVLCDLEGRTHEQAARHLGWPVGTVKSRQARGRERLRDRLRRRGLAPNAELLVAALRLDLPLERVPTELLDSTIKAALPFVAVRMAARSSAAALAREVLRGMAMTQWWKVFSILLVAGATASSVNAVGQRTVQDEAQQAQGNP